MSGCSAFGSLVTLRLDLRHGLFFLFCRCFLFSFLSCWCSFLIVSLLSSFLLMWPLLSVGFYSSFLLFLFFLVLLFDGIVFLDFCFWSGLFSFFEVRWFMLTYRRGGRLGLFFFRRCSNRRSCFSFPSLDSFSWLHFSDGTYRLGREGCFPFSLFWNGGIRYTRELEIQNTSFRLLTACLTGVFAG